MIEPQIVSVILPTFNRAYCIGRTIDSVLAQTFTRWELIICDDASTDDTRLVAQSYCENDSRIRYHRNSRNQGLPCNRNTGAALSGGELIYFIEDDVVIEPDCLEALVATFHQLESAGIHVGGIGPRTFEPEKKGRLILLERHVGNRMRKRMNGPSLIDRWTGLMYQNFALDGGEVMETVLVPSWSLFSKKALDEIGGYEERAYNRFNYSHEETDFFLRLRKNGYKLYFQPGAVAHHQHESRGGTRTSPVRYYYYFLGAHIAFLLRNFGWQSAYMIPACLLFMACSVVRSSPALLTGKA